MLMVAETLALRKELGSGSDVTGSARFWIRVMGECALQIHDYSETIVVSMVILEFQATGDVNADVVQDKGPWLGTLKLMVSVQGECAIQFQEYSEALLISIVMV
ncbi:Sodium- And Chloride-Dependent Betaine Transporter [Manis pentadactyla]|nr:Sodium- And Chloride-Dependent Betaine Transporter [Manis pentadactyla]